MSAAEIISAIAVTAELTNTQLSASAMKVMAIDLIAEYSKESILQALVRCRRELSGHLTQQAIIERINQADGRPGANEAWGIAISAFDEAQTVVLNDEITEAMGAARPVMDCGDDVGARMAFRDAYERIVRQNRQSGIKPKWYPSLGQDPTLRADAIKAAQDRGLLTHAQACAYLPAPITEEEQQRGNAIAGLLTGSQTPIPQDAEFRRRIADLMSVLKKPEAA